MEKINADFPNECKDWELKWFWYIVSRWVAREKAFFGGGSLSLWGLGWTRTRCGSLGWIKHDSLLSPPAEVAGVSCHNDVFFIFLNGWLFCLCACPVQDKKRALCTLILVTGGARPALSSWHFWSVCATAPADLEAVCCSPGLLCSAFCHSNPYQLQLQGVPVVLLLKGFCSGVFCLAVCKASLAHHTAGNSFLFSFETDNDRLTWESEASMRC